MGWVRGVWGEGELKELMKGAEVRGEGRKGECEVDGPGAVDDVGQAGVVGFLFEE